jgi:hypothetical protein
MKRIGSRCALILLSGFAALLLAQTPPPSLGEAARKARKPPTGKAKWTITNDNIPRTTVLTETKPMAAPTEAAPGAGPGEAPAEGAAPAAESKEDEKVWRAKFAKLRENLQYEERKLDVLQRELNLAQIQNYSDPNQAMREQFARTEITKRTTEIEDQKAKVDAAKKAIEASEDELRRKRLPAGWAR